MLRIGWFQTLRLNIRVLGVPGLRTLPIFVHRRVRVSIGSNGSVRVPRTAARGSIVLEPGCRFVINGQLEFGGPAEFGEACELFVAEEARLRFGGNFSVRKRLSLNCLAGIEFGSDCLLSWGVTVLDSDFHKILVDDTQVNDNSPISVGSNVWLGTNVIVLKGVTIADGVVVGSGSLVAKSLDQANSIYGGNPAKVLRTGQVRWER